MVIYRKYNTSTASGTHIRIPVPKAGSTDFATGSDWTPATGDVKLSKDGGSQANIGSLPTFSNGAWEFQLTGTELSCKQLEIMVVDSATKAIVDQAILIETFGNASAMYQADLSAAALAADVTKWTGTAVASPDTAGYPKVTVKSGTGTGEVSLSSGLVRLSATGVDDIWDEATAGHATAGTTGKALTDAGAAGSPPTVAQIADGVMTRASSNWEASAPAKSLGTAVMKLTHKVASAAGTLTTYRSDGSTTHVTQTETTDAAADPLTGLSGAS